MISRMRFSDRRMNSTWRNDWPRRGVMITPAKRERLDSVCAAAVIIRCGPSCCPASWPWIWPVSAASSAVISTVPPSSGRAVSIESTNSRYPRGVGIRPADVCGLAMNPISSRSDITLRMVAGERSRPEYLDRVREPTGWPSAM
ncbi:hypothetical protein D3C85_1299980 [compost metagenome]